MRKKRRKVSNVVLAAAVSATVIYAAAAIAVQLFTGAELSPTLTTAWFSFWGMEIISLAAIKTCKVRHSDDGTEPPDEDPKEPPGCD